MSMPSVVIVGGSIAGLTAANVLRDIGCVVDVYERTPQPLSGFGTGIVVQPELVRYVLERTEGTLEDISVPSSAMRYYDATTGQLRGEVDASWRFTAYNAIYQKLLDAFGAERYHLGHALTGLSDESGSTWCEFAGGTRVTADLIVCADGGGSVARSQLLGVSTQYAGYATWRGMIDPGDVSKQTWEFFEDEFTYGLLPDSHIIAYPIPQVTAEGQLTGRPRLNFQWYWNVEPGPALDDLLTDSTGHRHPVSVHHDTLPAKTLTSLRERAREELHGPFCELIERVPEPFVTTVTDAAVDTMAVGNVALIGDAAFTPRPHAAAGAAKAAADAWRLADHLAEADGDVAAALAAWEPERLAVGRAYLAKVQAMGEVLQHGGVFPPGAREFRFGLPVVQPAG